MAPSLERAVDAVRRHSRHTGSLLCLAAVALVYWILARPLVLGPIGYDESFFLWTGWSLNHGLVPYRDFVEYKPVAIFVLNALGLKLFGLDYHRYRALFAILTGASFLILAAALLRRGAGRVLTFCVIAAMAYALFKPGIHDLSLNDTETVGMSFFLLGVACCLWGGPRADRAHLVGGAFLALAVLSKEPYAFVSLATWGALGFWNRAEQRLPWRRFAVRSCAGAALVVGVVLAVLAATRALPFYVTLMKEYFGYTSRIGCSKPGSLAELAATAWGQLTRVLLTRDMLVGLVPFLIAFAVLARVGWGARLCVVAAVLASFHAVTLGGCYFRHYFIMGLGGLFLWGALGAVALGRWLAGKPPRLALGIGLAAIACASVPIGPRLRAELGTSYRVARVDLMGTPQAVVDFVNANTAPTDYVLSDGMPGIFLLTDRRRPTRAGSFLDELIDSYPGADDREKLAPIRADLLARPPKVIYFDRGYASRKRRTRAALLLPFIQELGYHQVMDGVYFLGNG